MWHMYREVKLSIGETEMDLNATKAFYLQISSWSQHHNNPLQQHAFWFVFCVVGWRGAGAPDQAQHWHRVWRGGFVVVTCPLGVLDRGQYSAAPQLQSASLFMVADFASLSLTHCHCWITVLRDCAILEAMVCISRCLSVYDCCQFMYKMQNLCKMCIVLFGFFL